MAQSHTTLLQDERPPRVAQASVGQSVACFMYDVTLKAEGITVQVLHEKLRLWCKRYVFQLEKGDSGYVHYQMRVSLIKKRRAAEIAVLFNDELFKGHWQPTTNNARDRDSFYQVKADTRLEGPWKDTDYEPTIVYTRQMEEFSTYEFHPWQRTLESLCREWDKRTIHWVYDKDGNKGKSDLVEWLDVNKIASVVPPMRNLEDIMQFCMSQKPAKAYIIDLPRAMKKEHLCEFYAGLEALKNGFLYDKRYKGTKKWIDRPAVIVFSNTLPDKKAMSADRWKIWHIMDLTLKPYYGI